jgi:hypothetical protein
VRALIMTATVILMPLVHRVSPHDPAWREQYARECAAAIEAQQEPPPRTRPILIAHVEVRR